jgi:hypothetical protein
MASDEELLAKLDAARTMVKSCVRSLRATLAFLAEIDAELHERMAEEAQRNGHQHDHHTFAR